VPLDHVHLRNLLADPNTPIPLQIDGVDAVIDGVPQEGETTVKARITFKHSPMPYALVPGGWLPMPFVSPQRFLVDRNVVSTLRSIRDHGARSDQAAFSWWTAIFDGGTGMFNPLPYAYEGSARRMPTLDEFVSSYKKGSMELSRSFPRAQVIQYDDVHFAAAYDQLLALEDRTKRDASFVAESIPLVLNRVARGKEASTLKQILATAERAGVIRNAPVVLAVLSVLFEDVHGREASIGRLLLKPTKEYDIGDAYNAVNDLRHMELAALGHGIFGHEPFALCTNDRAMALFWCALSIRGESTEETLLNFHYTLTRELLPRLSDEQLADLSEQLNDA